MKMKYANCQRHKAHKSLIELYWEWCWEQDKLFLTPHSRYSKRGTNSIYDVALQQLLQCNAVNNKAELLWKRSIQLVFFFRVFCLLVWSPHCDSSIPSQAFINQGDFRETELLVMSAVVSGINLLLPGLFNLCAWIENNDSPSIEVYVSVFRWEEELSKKINHITLNICLLTDTSHRIILSR